jgi:hypothetical protein
MIFNGKDIPNSSKEDVEQVSSMLHTVGDAIGAIASIVDDELRNQVMQAFVYIVSEAQFHMEGALNELLEAHAWQTPLEGETSSTTLFGHESLRESLMELTYNDDEREIVEGMFPPVPEKEEEDYESSD